MKKTIAILLCFVLTVALFVGCSGNQSPSSDNGNEEAAGVPAQTPVDGAAGSDINGDLPTITFTHGYFHDESEWAAAGEMRRIYEEFAELHKDEFNFVIVANEAGAEGIYNTALNDIAAGEFYDIADFGGWDITPVASSAGMILDLKPYLDEDPAFKNGVGVCYDQNLTEDGAIYSVREQIEAVGFWYNEALFNEAGAKVPGEWETWADFDEAVDTLLAADIQPFSLCAGWPANILAAGYSQRNAAAREFWLNGKTVESFDDESFRGTIEFMQTSVLQKIDVANFDPAGDSETYRDDFFDGKVAMLFNGVWDAGGSVGCGAGEENIKPAIFPTDEAGVHAALLSGGCGLVVSSRLDEAQTAAAIEFVKYMTSPEIASRIIAKGIGMAPGSDIDYDALVDQVDTADAKLLVEACRMCQNADYKALGLGNTFGDGEGEIQSKYAGLKDGSKTVDDVIAELDDFLALDD